MAAAETLAPSSAAFPDSLAGNWIKTRIARTPTGTPIEDLAYSLAQASTAYRLPGFSRKRYSHLAMALSLNGLDMQTSQFKVVTGFLPGPRNQLHVSSGTH